MIDDFLTAKKYISLAHHVKGRMRLKVNPAIAKDPVRKKLEEISGTLPGVLDTRVNLMARSVVVRYDPDIISPEEFETLVLSKDEDVSREIINKYQSDQNLKEV